MSGGWFINGATFDLPVENADGEKATITLRRLNAGDHAAIAEKLALRKETAGLSAGSGTGLGVLELVYAQHAVVDWTIPGPKPTPGLIAQLPEPIVELIWLAASAGNVPGADPDPTTPAKPATETTRRKKSRATADDASDGAS